MATTCKAGQGNPVMCRWRAPEVGAWMDFLDLDEDGQPDSGTTGNENGGRASYIHYAEPFPTMLDVSHLGLGDEPRHYVTAAVECLDLFEGTGIVYFLDTTNILQKMGTSNLKLPWLEIGRFRMQKTTVSERVVNLTPMRMSGYCSAPTTLTALTLKLPKRPINHMVVVGMVGCTYLIITLDFGL